MIGGMSWESTAIYYKLLNEEVKHRLGGLNSANCILYSVNFCQIEALQRQGDWDSAAVILADAARAVEAAGADFILICTNTMHLVFDQIQAAVDIPVIHIADTLGEQLQQHGLKKVGLLATAFTMEKSFYKNRLKDRFDIELITPNDNDRETVHSIIYQELCLGKIHRSSKEKYLAVINRLHQQGSEAIALGCTEINLLLTAEDSLIPLFDTTEIHAKQAVALALNG